MKRIAIAAVFASSLAAVFVPVAHAQVPGVGLAALGQGNIFEGFYGPWRPTSTGLQILYTTVCYDTATRAKAVLEVIADVPDGSSLAEIRVLATTAVVNGCAQYGITVPRGAVVLPAVQFGA